MHKRPVKTELFGHVLKPGTPEHWNTPEHRNTGTANLTVLFCFPIADHVNNVNVNLFTHV